MEKQESILIVDDDELLCENLASVLSEEGYSVVTVNKATAAIEQIKKQFFNVVLLDLMLPDMGRIDLLRIFSKKFSEMCFVILTGYAGLPSAVEALKAGAYDYIIKPFNLEQLVNSEQLKLIIERGIEKQRLLIINRDLVEHLEKEKYKIEIILDAYKKISGILKLDNLADFATATAIQIVEAEKASLMVIDESSGELILKGFKGLDKEKIDWRMKIGESIAGWVAKEGETLLVRDIDDDPRLKIFAKNTRYKTKSFISLPLKAESRVIGVMNVTDKLADIKIFTEEDLRFLTLLGHQIVAQIENIRLYEKLSSLAITDALTNLFNHRYFQAQLNLEIMRAQRYKHSLSLIMFDIDFFKAYNDRYGHLEGDRVLKEVAEVMRQNVRYIDIVCRYGGEEFMIILPETDIKGAKIVAEKIRKAVQTMSLLNSETSKALQVTISGGVATYQEGLSKDNFISRVDEALYKSKSAGRNKICIFE